MQQIVLLGLLSLPYMFCTNAIISLPVSCSVSINDADNYTSQFVTTQQGFIKDFFSLGGGGGVDVCKVCMCVSVHPLEFWTY